MKQLVTTGIILNRTNYGEADRIITLLTPDHGKLRLMAKGVRKVKSKLAGGIELFSVSSITYIQGRKEIGTLISARLVKHYGGIVKNFNRTMLGYELIKQLDKATEDQPEREYFAILEQVFEALDRPLSETGEPATVQAWFTIQLLRLGGHAPDLERDTTGEKLQADNMYTFSMEDMGFVKAGRNDGSETRGRGFTANHIKLLRLGFAGYPPSVLAQVQGGGVLMRDLEPLVQTIHQLSVR